MAALAGAALVLGIVALPRAAPTDAAFTDSEYARGTVTALTLRPPQIVSIPRCVRPPALGGTVFSIRWQWPLAAAPYSGLAAANVRFTIDGNVEVPSTVSDGDGRYTSAFDTALLSGLLGSLLGADITVEMRTTMGAWSSPGVTTFTYYAPLLGGAPTCTYTNG
ncbi:hypothetical protein [Microbacterium luticocti]|uniref:hypothetical protein n=1 Tax=Microbacterium luticocti TaxID=451764 RepID=UPI0012ECB3DB|nr:hypothetical protein [Microbacterium luticocti]